MSTFGNGIDKLFGYVFGSGKQPDSITKVTVPEEKSFTAPSNEDGSLTIQSTPYYGTYVDFEGSFRNEVELITRYRNMSLQPELEQAIDEVVNEAIVRDDDGNVLKLDMAKLKDLSDGTRKKIEEEFDVIKRLLNWNYMSDEIFRRWYVDGRLNYHMIVNENEAAKGIKEIRYIDPRKIRKVREIEKKKDPTTGVEYISKINEFYIFTDKVANINQQGTAQVAPGASILGVKIAPDAIINVTSGKMDERGQMVLSYLHKAIKPLNQLRMMEDASVIYRLSRAAERRVFYIDVGNLPRQKAEQYLYDIMMKYRNKMVYDSNTGELRDDRKHLSMLEDFWIPRRGEGKNTEITTLPGGQNLGQMDDVIYFEKKLYKSLGVPKGRLDSEQQPSIVGIGRSTEVTREELRFARLIERLRNRFVGLFINALGVQLNLKGVCTKEEWDKIKEDIQFVWLKDNNYEELMESELLKDRLATLAMMDPYVGRYFSPDWVRAKVLRFSEKEIKQMKKEIDKATKENDPALQPPPGMGGDGQQPPGGEPPPGIPLSTPPGEDGGAITDPNLPGAPQIPNGPQDNTGIMDESVKNTVRKITEIAKNANSQLVI